MAFIRSKLHLLVVSYTVKRILVLCQMLLKTDAMCPITIVRMVDSKLLKMLLHCNSS